MDYKFQINLRGIIDLLSHHLYSGPQVYLRELLQNGVDAIQARTYLDPDHRGEITLEIIAPRPPAPPTLAFMDNGVGLTEDEIHRFLATIGESSKRGEHWDRPTDFLGQFGIGLLSCFVVADEIVVLTRSAKGGPTLEWRGRPDGTYSVRTLDRAVAPGTQVYLTCKKGCEEYFEPDRVAELAAHFGSLLPFPVRLVAGKGVRPINDQPPPWRARFAGPDARRKALLAYGRKTFGSDFFDAIPLRAPSGEADGVAFVLPRAPSLAARRTHRVYLKNMLLSETADNLLPDWAFFVKCVVSAHNLRPTASRESFYEDEALAATREELGQCLRDYLVGLAKRDPERLQRFIALHALSIKALAVQDDDFYRLFIDWLPFETSQGEMTLGEYRQKNPVLRWVRGLDQFRQIARVAAAQGLGVVNGAYTYNAELLDKFADTFPDAQVEEVDPASLTQTFEELTLEERETVFPLVKLADVVLQPFKCAADVKKFLPRELPTLYSSSAGANFLRSVDQAREVADPLWSSVLGNLSGRAPGDTYAQLCFNFNNPLVTRLAQVKNKGLLQRSIQMLYVQALLLGHHPLSAREMGLLNEGLLGLIEWGVESQEKGGRMSEDHAERIEDLLDEASLLEDGPAKVMLLEEAVRLADAHADALLGYDTRQDLIHAATFGGYPEKALVAFTWCLAQCDREAGGHLGHDMLWKYKWIANILPEFAHIPLGQIQEILDDMTRRYEKAGMSLRAVHKLRCGMAMGMGDRAAARLQHRAWQQAPLDAVSDCPACERNHRVKYLFFKGKDEEGLTHAAPILEGRLRCAEIPHATLARVLLPLLRLGRPGEAMAYHRQGLRLVTRNRSFLREVGMHMTFLTLTDNLAHAVRLLERHLPWALERESHARRFDFFLAARFVLERLAAAGKAAVRLQLPQGFAPCRAGGRYDVAELAAWFEADLQGLAERFDARNGTDWFARRLAENRALKDQVSPFPEPSRRPQGEV